MEVKKHDEDATIMLPAVVDLTTAPGFKQALQSLYEQNCETIYVDCCHLEMIDSAGIGSLALYQKRFQEKGGELRLVNVNNSYIKHLFDMIDLQRVIHIE